MTTERARQITLLSPFFHPERISTGRYNGHLAEALAKQGLKIDVICSHPLYPGWKPQRHNDELAAIRLHRGGLWMRYPRSPILRRLFLELWFSLHCLGNIACLRRSDCLVSILPPNLGQLLANLIVGKGAIKVGIVHDLQGIMAYSVKSPLRRLITRGIRFIEKQTLASCDRLLCLSASMRDFLINEYGIAAERCVICYPFVSLTENHADEDCLATIFAPHKRHIVYAGALGEKQRPADLLRLFRSICRDHDDICCHLFSNGPIMDAIRQELAQQPQAGLFCHNLVADDQLGHLYAYSSLQVIPQASGTGAGAFPSKLPNLFAAGVPVLALCDDDSELAQILRQANAGLATGQTDSNDWPAMAVALLDSCEDETHQQRATRLRPFIEQHFSVHKVVNEILRQS